MYGNNLYKWLSGDQFNTIGTFLSTGLALSEADADSPTAVLERGTMVEETYATKALAVATGNAIGILEERVSLNGIEDATGFRSVSIGKHDLPAKRGAYVAVRQPQSGAFAEFEGLGAAAVGNFVVTATTTGFLSTNTPINTPLSLNKGGWIIAQAGNQVHAILKDPNMTPIVSGNRRIVVMFVSPYNLVVDT